MTTIEKGMIAAIVFSLGIIIFSVITVVSSIEEAGGFKQLIIDVGKEVKEISREISKD